MMLERLRRTTRDGRWFPEVDGLRFLAIAAVVVLHLAGEVAGRGDQVLIVQSRYHWLGVLIGNGDRGVRLFFVISGFILALPFARAYLHGGRRVSVRKFYLRRLTRLEPPYLLALAIITVALFTYLHHLPAGFLPHLAATSVYVNSLIFGTLNPVSPVVWSLEVEIQFYLFAPLVMQLLRIRPVLLRRVGLLIVMALCGWMQFHFAPNRPRLAYSVVFYIQYFLAGILVADLFVADGETTYTGYAWDFGALGVLLYMGFAERAWTSQIVLPFLLPVLCLAAFHGRILRRFLRLEWVAVIGGMCYSIYLLHFTLMAVVFKVTRRIVFPSDFLVSLLLQMVVTLLPVLALCTIFYVLVEKPCMDPAWPSRLWRRLTGHNSPEADRLDASGISQ